jgi:hypothetical protein
MAVHQACGSLGGGESDLTLAGGVVVTLEPRKSVSGSLQGMLSPTGRCHAFDVNADGWADLVTTGSQGINVLLSTFGGALSLQPPTVAGPSTPTRIVSTMPMSVMPR